MSHTQSRYTIYINTSIFLCRDVKLWRYRFSRSRRHIEYMTVSCLDTHFENTLEYHPVSNLDIIFNVAVFSLRESWHFLPLFWHFIYGNSKKKKKNPLGQGLGCIIWHLLVNTNFSKYLAVVTSQSHNNEAKSRQLWWCGQEMRLRLPSLFEEMPLR